MMRSRLARMALVGTASLLFMSGCASAVQGGSGPVGTDLDYIGPGPESAEAARLIESAGQVDDTSFCGTDPVTIGVADGVGLNGWSANSYATVRSELAKCDNVTQVVTVGQGDITKSITDVNGLVAQGVDGIVLIPDFGEVQLQSIQAATAAGVKVVNWGADPAGIPGKDYVAYVDWDPRAAGEIWARWISEQLGGKGTIAYLGGPAGNPVSTSTLEGIVSVVEDNPGLELLTGSDSFPATNWDPSEAQTVMASLIAKYPKIDALITDDSSSSVGALRAFVSSDRTFPIIATLESNLLACTYLDAKAAHPEVEIATMSARNWMGRIAARKTVAAVQGLPNNEPSLYNLPLFEDSTTGVEPKCDATLSPDTLFSNQLSLEVFEKWGNAN